MTSFLLTTDEAAADAGGFDEILLWSGSSPRTTFIGPLDQHLSSFGPVRQENVDFARIALGVFAADRSVRRQGGGSDWNAREIDLTIEVGVPAAWTAQADQLSTAIGFLTGDRWTFRFMQAAPNPIDALPLKEPTPDRTVLLSGGADSAAGALIAALDLAPGATLQLVSHFSAPSISPFQRDLVRRIRALAPKRVIIHRRIALNRHSKRLDGTMFKREPSSRSRSLLFLALGLAAAERSGGPLFIPENGFASLNPPLGPERRGALSTHTTHPRFLTDLQELLASVGAHGLIENPFQTLTKGEMFSQVAERIGAAAASDYLSASNSCAHTDARFQGAPPGASCGVCFGCLVRRASFHAGGLADATDYLATDPGDRYADFVQQKSIVQAMFDFVADDPKPYVVMKMSLPESYPAGQALDLCRRGVAELRGFLS
ncbi:hypothetical protein N866_00500 [Actinotalea ferrariae CF5-4]|uniref:7-cyano-7-deazaguanine synthase n=1 Tax=Actinotalea ferrariae CF5-4 TaxID=948458 RepID=A0A021VVU6_9CELL|nr:hypothetical protein [Actinotalea ferrariae]EYR65286.1 hypothetical protein N866_00500 [Actinotalea ferrariae CF5-4]